MQPSLLQVIPQSNCVSSFYKREKSIPHFKQMGCNSSRTAEFHAECVDDSIHAMLARELRKAQQKGQKVCGYRPAQPHPLLQKQQPITCTEDDEDDDDDDVKTTLCSVSGSITA